MLLLGCGLEQEAHVIRVTQDHANLNLSHRHQGKTVTTRTKVIAVALGLLAISSTLAQPPAADLPSDIPAKLNPVEDSFDFSKRDLMIPMRDGVKLHTVILLPKGLTHAPLLLTRTPYGASKAVTQADSSHVQAVVPWGDDIVMMSGYIRVYQDVRGKYGSEG